MIDKSNWSDCIIYDPKHSSMVEIITPQEFGRLNQCLHEHV